MESLTPQQDNKPNKQDQQTITNASTTLNDRPKTDDGFSDEGTTAAEVDGEDSEDAHSDDRGAQELSPARNTENPDPSLFDIDESTQ